jgi:hypothetical protein
MEIQNTLEKMPVSQAPTNPAILLTYSNIPVLNNVGLLKLNKSEYSKIKALFDSNNGLPTYMPNNYLRLLYLSATTITTLGYGDIVPITNSARVLTALEAILGVVIAGFFVSFAVSGKAKKE